jgi:hypothetical protein
MPALHRYFGTPLTTWILNTMYGTHFSDIHCGMRGITKDALIHMRLVSQSWDYASEMVLKSVHMGLQQAEVPVHFLRDMDGRQSHHLRAGWTSPWKAGWINLRAMFVFGCDFLLWYPGIICLLAGFMSLALLSMGPLRLGGVVLSLNAMLFGLVLYAVGLQMVLTAIVASVITDQKGHLRKKWSAILSYTRTFLVAASAAVAGAILVGQFVLEFLHSNLTLAATADTTNHLAIVGLALIISALLLFTNMLVLHAVAIYVPDPARPSAPTPAVINRRS